MISSYYDNCCSYDNILKHLKVKLNYQIKWFVKKKYICENSLNLMHVYLRNKAVQEKLYVDYIQPYQISRTL